MNLYQSRAAGDVTVTRYKNGKVIACFVVKAGSLDTLRDEPPAKRGPKPKASEAYAAANRFARSANY